MGSEERAQTSNFGRRDTPKLLGEIWLPRVNESASTARKEVGLRPTDLERLLLYTSLRGSGPVSRIGVCAGFPGHIFVGNFETRNRSDVLA